MAIHQTGKPSDLEKRLKLLRTQVYGKELVKVDVTKTSSISSIPSNISVKSDVLFLRQDLLKISILTGLALGTQIVLFYLSKNHVLNLNFF